jgi:hypothetical protein
MSSYQIQNVKVDYKFAFTYIESKKKRDMPGILHIFHLLYSFDIISIKMNGCKYVQFCNGHRSHCFYSFKLQQ